LLARVLQQFVDLCDSPPHLLGFKLQQAFRASPALRSASKSTSCAASCTFSLCAAQSRRSPIPSAPVKAGALAHLKTSVRFAPAGRGRTVPLFERSHASRALRGSLRSRVAMFRNAQAVVPRQAAFQTGA